MKRSSVLFLLFILTVFFQGIATGEIKKELSLKEAVTIGLENNPELKALRERLDALSNIPPQAGSLPDPVLSFSALNLPTDSFSLDQEPMTQMQVKLVQKLPFPGKLSLKKEIEEYRVRAVSERVNELALRLKNQIEQLWWKLFYLQKTMEIIHKSKNYLEQMIEVARNKYEVGKGLSQDVILAQVELSSLYDKEAKIQGKILAQKAKLIKFLGDSDLRFEKVALHGKITLNPLPNEEKLIKIALAKRPLLYEKRSKIEEYNLRLTLAKKSYFPDFSIGAAYGFRQDAPSGMKRSDFASFMFSLNIPLWAKSKQSHLIEQKSHQLVEKQHELAVASQQMQAEIRQALSLYRASYKRTNLYKNVIIPQAEQNLSAMLNGYQVNRVDFLNVIRAQLALIRYKQEYWQAVTEAQRAKASLEAAIGQDLDEAIK